MEINQRNFTSTTTNGTYGFDRWFLRSNDTITTYSAQPFTVGVMEDAGGVPKNYARIVTSGQSAATTLSALRQNVEEVRTFAGKTVTFSFWARAASGTPTINVSLTQVFGTGGSSVVEAFGVPKTISTTWQRHSFTVNVPSISGKTIGTGANFLLTSIFVSTGTNYPQVGVPVQNNTFDFWGIQLEEGSSATPFSRAAGTLQGELAACQRYYYRIGSETAFQRFQLLTAQNATTSQGIMSFPVTMRAAPTSIEFSALATLGLSDGVGGTITPTAITLDQPNTKNTNLSVGGTGMTAFRNYYLIASNNATAFIGVSSEL
jgi:hypothetical protein